MSLQTALRTLWADHRGGRQLVVVTALFLLAILLSAGFLTARTLAAPLLAAVPTTAATSTGIAASMPDPTPTPGTGAATSAPRFTPAPTPITSTLLSASPYKRFIWSPDAPDVFWRKDPGGKALGTLENGTEVLCGDLMPSGGITWTLVEIGGEYGWVAEEMVVVLPDTPALAFVTGSQGAYLRSDPGGAILALLPHGTPLTMIDAQADNAGTTWIRVQLPDGRTGWTAQSLLGVTP